VRCGMRPLLWPGATHIVRRMQQVVTWERAEHGLVPDGGEVS
jgi:hypothetical protein